MSEPRPAVGGERQLGEQRQVSEQRRVGGLTATLLVVANMIGTGVFTTTGFLVRDVPSNPAILAGWLLGGLLALAGALAYSELTAALPRNGGEYQILARVYHPALGFIAGWISLIVGFSAPIAAASLAFGKYLSAIAPSVHPTVASVSLVLLLSALHAAHVRIGGGVQNVLTIAKVLLVAIFIVGGMLRGELSLVTQAGSASVGEAILTPAFAVGLIYISFSYSGWNGAAYLAGEVKNPQRTLPLALTTGTLVVTLLYVGLNATFLAAAPRATLSGVVEIGHVAAQALFGARAGNALSAVIALALSSSVSAMVMAGPRVYQAMGVDCPRLAWLARRGAKGGPIYAIALQAAVALTMVATATFERLLSYIGFTLSISAGLTVFGVFMLRAREPQLQRPYRALGHPFTPAAFTLLSLWMVIHSLVSRPIVGLFGLGTLLSGGVLYLLLGPQAGRHTQG